MRRLKVLHLITGLPRLSGAADNTRHTVNLLDRERYEVHLGFGPTEVYTDGLRADVRTFLIDTLVRPVAPVSDFHTILKLLQLLRRERYDIVHTHSSKAGVLGRVASRLTGVPIIVHTAHTISFAASSSPLINALYRWSDRVCARWTDRIITVSRLNTDRYLAARVGRPQQYETVYSGVDTNRFVPGVGRTECRAELGIRPEHVLVTFIGRLNRQKDPLTYLRACKVLAERHPHARFVIVGEDSIGESIEGSVRNAIETLGLAPRLQLLGYRPDIERILAASDVVLHSSLYEGLGRAIVETMLAAVPIVATSVDGVPEAIVSGVRGGYLVPPGDPKALAEAASRVIEHPELARPLAEAGRRWVLDRFDVHAMVRRIDQIYQDLQNRPSRVTP